DGPGTHLRITLGRLRQATAGHAIAAKATAITVAITQAPEDTDRYGETASHRIRTTVDLSIGLLEAAAVAPEPGSDRARGAVSAAGAGAGGGLPITGPPVGVLAIGGAALLATGATAM